MTDDKVMVKLEELYKVAIETENVMADWAVVDYMCNVGQTDDSEGDN